MLDHLGSLSTIKRKVHKPVPVDDKMVVFELYYLEHLFLIRVHQIHTTCSRSMDIRGFGTLLFSDN